MMSYKFYIDKTKQVGFCIEENIGTALETECKIENKKEKIICYEAVFLKVERKRNVSLVTSFPTKDHFLN